MTKTELVLFPSNGRGHLVSAVEFAKLITKTNPNISILVIIFHMPFYNSTTIENYIESETRQLDPTRFTFLILPPLQNPPSPSSPNFFSSIVNLQKPLIKEALNSRPNKKPLAFILDLVCVNFVDIAKEFQIPCYIYFTGGSSLLTLQFHLQEILDQTGINLAIENYNSDKEFEIPGFKNRVPAKVFPIVICDKNNEWSSLIHETTRKFRETQGILINTFMELEPYSIQALQTLQNQGKIPQVYPIGPIIASKPEPNRITTTAIDTIMRWLDDQPPCSVVFLCFGSLGTFNEKQVKEIAKGLHKSGHKFLWSLRKPLKSDIVLPSENEIFEEALPLGFLEKTVNQGKVIGWAPQTEILAHKSVGGFVSHCGWNSILESVWYGVPIATWPVYSEQQLNAFELVKEYGIGVEIRVDYRRDLMEEDGNFIVMADEIEDGVNKLMGMGDDMKERVKKMRDLSRDVLQVGGYSHTWLNRFINQVLDLE